MRAAREKIPICTKMSLIPNRVYYAGCACGALSTRLEEAGAEAGTEPCTVTTDDATVAAEARTVRRDRDLHRHVHRHVHDLRDRHLALHGLDLRHVDRDVHDVLDRDVDDLRDRNLTHLLDRLDLDLRHVHVT